MAMTDTHVWLEYPDTGGKAQFPLDAADAWRARGWRDCEPDPEPDRTKDPSAPEPPAEPEPEPPEPETRPASRRRGADAAAQEE